MNVAVLGGGLQGCCVAMALADKGIRVTLFDRNAALLSRAALANEGKIHLGYMYAADPTLKTARMMMQGALAFGPFFSAYLGAPLEKLAVSRPAAYVVHRASQKPAEDVQAYLLAVHALVQEAAEGRANAYFHRNLTSPIRAWSTLERDRVLSADEILAAFDSPELAIDPVALAEMVRRRVEETPTIDVRLEHTVTSVEEEGLQVTSSGPWGELRESFDHVVNALWDGRLAIDASMGRRPTRPWMHRLKYGVSFRPPAASHHLRSITVVLGPFGEVVCYRNGSVYLTWYPDCLRAITQAVQPPDWPTYPAESLRSEIFHGTFEALARILPALSAWKPEDLSEVVVRGGPIVAWGATDIYDPGSELHRRFEIGVTSVGRYHSIDPGKLTLAPFFALECVKRIARTEAGNRSGARRAGAVV